MTLGSLDIVNRVAARNRDAVALRDEDIVLAEQLIGRPLPSLVRELYARCGNGGFGPGTRPLVNSWDDSFDMPLDELSAVRSMRSSPAALLGLFDWGCGVESYVDLDDPTLRIVRFDPCFVGVDPETLRLAPKAFAFPGLACDHDDVSCYQLESRSLSEWLDVWLEGFSVDELRTMAPQRTRWIAL